MTNTQLIDIFDLIVPHETTLFNEEETCCSILIYDNVRFKEVSDVTCYPREYNDWCYKPDEGEGGGFCKEEDRNNPFKFCLKMVCVVITLPFYIGKILFYDCETETLEAQAAAV